MTPPGVDPRRLLVILDLSWWLTRAWHIALSAELGKRREEEATADDHARAGSGMVATFAGWLAELLTPPTPACIAAALDSVGPTWRHARTAHLPEERRYKAGRPARPVAYQRARNVALDLVSAHGIPLLAAEGWEADDAIAAAVVRARALGLAVAICSSDKDHAALVGPGVVQWAWGGGTGPASGLRDMRGVAEVTRRYGVPPALVPDWLAIAGDAGDGVHGAEGVGDKGAVAILEVVQNPLFVLATPELTPLDRALGLEVAAPPDAALDAARRRRNGVRDAPPNALAGDDARARHAARLAEAEGALEGVKRQRALARLFERLRASRETVLLARELVTLDAAAPIRWVPEELPVGGFDVPELRRLYERVGFTALAREVRPMAKRTIEEVLSYE
jgi:5'-3' exonuclease